MPRMAKRPLSTRSLGYAQADKRIDILKQVALHGSISEAARSAGVSYKAAWQAIHTLTNLAGEPLVDSSVGGAGGGGARDPMVRVRLALDGGGELASLITRESAELLTLAPGLPLLVLAKATAVRVVPGTDPAAGAGATGLTGQALRLSRGSQRDEVTLTLAGGQQLVGFADRPNRLRTGSRVTAWLDDTAVVLALSG